MKIQVVKDFFDDLRRRFPPPTAGEIQKRLERFENSEYGSEENSLIRLFQGCPGNTTREDVLLKATALKSFLHQERLNTATIVRHILNTPDFDKKLNKGVKSLVDGIALSSRAKWKYTTFARYYCGCHKPDAYLIDPPGTSLALLMYDRQDHFSEETIHRSMNRYSAFARQFEQFRDFYHLQDNSLLDIQHFLYQVAKDDVAEFSKRHPIKRDHRAFRNAEIMAFIESWKQDEDAKNRSNS